MNIPPFWASDRYEGRDSAGELKVYLATGWSYASLAEAREMAGKRARHIFDVLTSGRKPLRYEYHDRPIREEIVTEIKQDDVTTAMITRNRYGALVLNCANAMFVDVDFQSTDSDTGFMEGLALAFSRKKREEKRLAEETAQTKHIEDWAAEHPEHSFRLYRTKAGFRLMFTDRLYEPGSDETQGIMWGLNADPLYIKLTEKQKCFRARLTSKPWRCDFYPPTVSYPWATYKTELKMRQWEKEYTQKDSQFRACELVQSFGGPVAPELQQIMDGHDRACKVNKELPLA